MSIVIMTGTGTDVGKTVATGAVACALQKGGYEPFIVKPAQTGEPEGEGDAPRITALTGIDKAETLYRFPEPLAPATSARRASMPYPELTTVAEKIKSFDEPGRVVLVEGAGGLLVRIGQDWTIADLARELGAPIIVVCSTGLGSLNEAELTVEAAIRRGLTVLGLIGGSIPDSPDLATRCNKEDLPEVTGADVLGYIPEGAGGWSQQRFVQEAPGFFVPDVVDRVTRKSD